MSKLELINHKSYPRNRSESIRLKNPTRIELYTQDSSSREQAINSETELHEQARAERRGKLRTFTPTEGPVHGLVLPEEPEPPGPRRRRLLRDAVRRRGRHRRRRGGGRLLRRSSHDGATEQETRPFDRQAGSMGPGGREEQRSSPLLALVCWPFSLVSSLLRSFLAKLWNWTGGWMFFLTGTGKKGSEGERGFCEDTSLSLTGELSWILGMKSNHLCAELDAVRESGWDTR